MNRRIRTGVIRARALDNRHIYTTHTVIRTSPGKPVVFGSLDTHPGQVAKVVW